MNNLVAGRDRAVSVADVGGSLEPETLRSVLLGREVYRRTRYVVARHGSDCALVEVARPQNEALFSSVTAVDILATQQDCAYVRAPGTDTAVPSQLAATARELAPAVRCVVVEGRYGHVGFILNPQPVRIRVVDVVPPEPAKLLDQARRAVAEAEHLPPVELVADLLDIHTLLGTAETPNVLLPCRGSGVEDSSRPISYLDERPPRADWTLIGCTRSEELHTWFYSEPPRATVDLCPARRATADDLPTLTKCCLLETGSTEDGERVTVGWGATLEDVRTAVTRLALTREPAWTPA